MASRLAFQTSTANATTNVGALPSGTGTTAQYFAYAGSDPDNAPYLRLAASAAAAIVDSNKNGAGTSQDLIVRANGGTSSLTLGAATAAITAVGTVVTPASAAGAAGIRLPHGSAPSSPVNGDLWTTTAGLFVRINGATVGPLS